MIFSFWLFIWKSFGSPGLESGWYCTLWEQVWIGGISTAQCLLVDEQSNIVWFMYAWTFCKLFAGTVNKWSLSHLVNAFYKSVLCQRKSSSLFWLAGHFVFLTAGMGIQDAVSAKLVLEKLKSEHWRTEGTTSSDRTTFRCGFNDYKSINCTYCYTL